MQEPAKEDDLSVRQAMKEACVLLEIDEIYERAFGQFLIAWADAEREMYHVLLAYSGVTTAVGRAIFSGVRMKAMMDYIRSIDNNAPLPLDRSTDLAHVFSQIGLINAIRDHLVHHSSQSYSYTKGTPARVVANTRASRFGNAQGYEVTPEVLEQLTQDLCAIANHLNTHHGPRSGPFTPWREGAPDDPPTPWLYKQLQPIDSWETPPEGALTSPLRQKSSPQKQTPHRR